MNKTLKMILSVIIVFLVLAITYFLIARKTNVFHPTSKVPVPITFQENGAGCGNIFVYKISDDDSAGVSVDAKKEKLNLSTDAKTFEIGKTDGLNVEILMGEKIRRLYCSDVLYPDQSKPKKLIGISGKATISISEIDESQPEWERGYTTTVILKDVRFVDESGNSSNVIVEELILKDISVGWFPG